MKKIEYSERDICSKLITPAVLGAGWDLQTQIAEEKTLTDGRIIVRGKMVARGKQKRADYVLYLKPNIPIAVIEAKDRLCCTNWLKARRPLSPDRLILRAQLWVCRARYSRS